MAARCHSDPAVAGEESPQFADLKNRFPRHPAAVAPCSARVLTGDLLLSAMRSRLGDPLQSMRAAPGRPYENVVFVSQIRRGEMGMGVTPPV